MNEKDFDDIEVPVELENELARLRSKEKIYSWLFTGIVGIALIGGAWLYTHQTASEKSFAGTTPSVNAEQTGNISNAYYGQNNASNSSGSAVGGGGCCGGSGTGGATQEQLASLEKQALDDYKVRFGEQKVTAKAADYGCHIQIDIYDNNNKLIHSYAYRGDQLNFIQ